MTYTRNQTEYLEPEEMRIYQAIRDLVAAGRTANNSQIARKLGIPATRVLKITRELWLRSYLVDKGRGSAYHWRPTGKPALTEDSGVRT